MLSMSVVQTLPRPQARRRAARPRLQRVSPPKLTSQFALPRRNQLLAALPADTYQRILSWLEPVTMRTGEVLYEPGRALSHVYFPTTSVVSLTCETADGDSTEIGVVGNDGLLGFALFMGGETTCSRADVVVGGLGYRMESSRIKREVNESGAFAQVLLRYTQVLITQLGQAALCNAHHSLDQRLCRRLLQSIDRLATNELAMTHSQLSGMLAVRREGVTEAAGRLRTAGLIEGSRGCIRIVDRSGLEARACECYGVVKRESERLMPGGMRGAASGS